MSADPITLEIDPERRQRTGCPIMITTDVDLGKRNGVLVSETGSELPIQSLADGSAAFILNRADPGRNRTFRLAPQSSDCVNSGSDMSVVDNGDSTLSIIQDDDLVTRYNYGKTYARPFFYPVNEPGGRCVTRSYPMQALPGESADHPHHKSMWIAHGDVNGVDNWSEEKGHGYTRHQSIDAIDQGPVLARFRTTSLWCDAEDTPLLTQRLIATFWHGDSAAWMMDFNIQLTANVCSEDLVFGDTKEGGILSVRVASALDAAGSGRISNVYGGEQEGECWGQHSHWCSYSGEIEHKPCGIGVFDHPDGFRSPTTWHVRNYGLMTANPFGYSAFTNGRTKGSYTLKAGEAIEFKYRVITHNNPDFNTECSARYLDFAFPPTVRVLGY